MSTAFQLKALREQRGTIKKGLEDLGTKLKTETRAFSPDEKTAFDKLKTDWVAVSESIRAVEGDINAIDSLIGGDDAPAMGDPAAMGGANAKKTLGKQDRDHGHGDPNAGDVRQRVDRCLALKAWTRTQGGFDVPQPEAEACNRLGLNPRAKEFDIAMPNPRTRRERMQQRALTVTTTAGGNLIAQDYSYLLENTLVSFSNVRGVCDEFTTDTGANLPYPTEDDTGNTGELLAINTAVATADPTFATVTFASYKFSSKSILVPNELMQDSAFDLDAYLMEALGTRIGRIQGSYFTTGTGSSQPHGVVTVSVLGATSADAAAINGTDLTNLAFSLDPSYRSAPGVGYMMKDDVIGYLLTLKDANGRPLLRESFRDGAAGAKDLMINGFPVYPNQFMTGLTSSVPVTATKHVLFGDFKALKIRDAGGIRLKRLDERYAEVDQVAFLGFLRSDSRCVNTAKIKHLIQA